MATQSIKKTAMTTLPNFLIVGAAKSGTTSLYHYLKSHPEIFMCTPKEPKFICADLIQSTRNGIGDTQQEIIHEFKNYCRLFDPVDGEKAVGEASTTTLNYYQESIPFIHEVIGNPKIIIILRNPIERAFSAFKHLKRDHREFLSFEEGLNREEDRRRQGWGLMWRYKERGMYFEAVKAFMEQFSHVKVLLFDDLHQTPRNFIKDVFEFLEVNTDFVPNLEARYNASGIPKFNRVNHMFVSKNLFQKTARRVGTFIFSEDRYIRYREKIRSKFLADIKMRPETRIYLQDVFREDIQKLGHLLNRDLSIWLRGTS